MAVHEIKIKEGTSWPDSFMAEYCMQHQSAALVLAPCSTMFKSQEAPCRSRADAFRIGADIAAAVTASNPAPVTLKFEKVYHPCVLLTKKRYVGYMYESPKQVCLKVSITCWPAVPAMTRWNAWLKVMHRLSASMTLMAWLVWPAKQSCYTIGTCSLKSLLSKPA